MRAAFVLLVLVLLVAAFAVELAMLLDRRIEQATGGVVRLADARGTVWSGRYARRRARPLAHPARLAVRSGRAPHRSDGRDAGA